MQKYFSKTLVSVIIIVAVVVGFLAWSHYFQTKGPGTYINEEYGFEINYPSGWYTYEYQGKGIISTFSKIKYGKYYGKTEVEKLGESYGVIEIDFPNQTVGKFFSLTKSAIEKLKEASNSGYIIEKFTTEDITILGLQGYKLYYSGRSFFRFEEGEKSINIVYLISTRDNKGTMRFEGSFKGGNSEEYANDFEKMLSTFRFID